MYANIYVLLQMNLKWEHKTRREKLWTEYSPKHSILLTQAIICVLLIFDCGTQGSTHITIQAINNHEQEVILEHEGVRWRVDMRKMQQDRIGQFSRLLRKQCKVRYLVRDI